MTHSSKKLGVALLGLGNYSITQLAPALSQCKNCKLVAIITGTPVKASMFMRKYNVPSENVYNYSNLASIVNNDDVDIIYVTTPNALHVDFVKQAAQAKKHVICEKPLGLNETECVEMICACEDEGVKLSVGYRLLHDPHIHFLKHHHINDPIHHVQGKLSFDLNIPTDWRYNKEMAGGGALMDIGIYGIYTACYILNESPMQVKVESHTMKESSNGIETSISFKLIFEHTVVHFEAGYDGLKNEFQVVSQSNKISINNAFSPSGQFMEIDGVGKAFNPINQVAHHLDDFSNAIIKGETARVTGYQGLRDAQIISAIYKSMETGKVEQVVYS